MPDTKVKIEKSGVKSALGVASKEYVEMISFFTIANSISHGYPKYSIIFLNSIDIFINIFSSIK